MDVKLLSKSEMLVECWVRGIPVSSSDINPTIPTLQEKISNEWINSSFSSLMPHVGACKDPLAEINLCFLKLNDIKKIVKSLTEEEKEKANLPQNLSMDKCHSRLIHVSGRLSRLLNISHVKPVIEKVKDICDSFIHIIEDMISEVITAKDGLQEMEKFTVEIPKDQSINEFLKQNFPTEIFENGPEKSSSNIDVSSDTFSLQEAFKCLSLNESSGEQLKIVPGNSKNCEDQGLTPIKKIETPNSQSTHYKSVPTFQPSPHRNSRSPSEIMHNWNIYFDGISQDTTVQEFAFRVCHLAQINRIPLQQVADNLYVLLKGIALKYYWHCIRTITPLSWERLISEMEEQFQSLRTDSQIRHNLSSRRQRSGETFVNFYNNIKMMASPIQDQISKREMVNILRNSMRPGLQLHLATKNYTNVSDLVRDCIALEENWAKFNYNPEAFQIRRHVSEIEEDRGELTVSNSWETDEVCEMKTSFPSRNSFRRDKPKSSNGLVCWNCHIPGHTFKDCELDKQGCFCYGCGKANVLKPQCPNCTKDYKRQPLETQIQNVSTRTKESVQMVDAASNVDPDFFRLQRRK